MIDFETLSAERRRTAKETIKIISAEELTALGMELFPEPSHPWHDIYAKFLEEHGGDTCYSGHTGDDIWFVYCPTIHRGLWYLPHGTRGVGPLGERGVNALDEIIAEKFGPKS